MSTHVLIGDRPVGHSQSYFIVAEIGINHNGDVEIAKRLIDVAADAGCDAVKFQKRTPEICVKKDQWDIPRETPWGTMSYISYRRRTELGQSEYEEIDTYCKRKGVTWFASAWDVPSVDFLSTFSPPCYKVASASLTDDELLLKLRETGVPIILSTGMSTVEQIRHAIGILGKDELVVLHCTSSYPARNEELNLRMIETLSAEFGVPVGYSGHEIGVETSLAARALGASLIERHITLDRTMWGTDQSASLEPDDLALLVRGVRTIESALGDGVKRVYESELPVMEKLRRV